LEQEVKTIDTPSAARKPVNEKKTKSAGGGGGEGGGIAL